MERSTTLSNIRLKKAVSIEGIITLTIIVGFFVYMSIAMGGAVNMFNTLMATAYDLLIGTVFMIMGIAVLAGSFAGLISEFGVVSLINRCLSKIMKPVYNLPGVAALGILTTFLSDNPAILTLTKDKSFRTYFTKSQLPALTNLGTSFGMGLVIITFMISQATDYDTSSFVIATFVGVIGAIIGSIFSVRIMLYFTKRKYGSDSDTNQDLESLTYDYLKYREIKEGSILERALDSILEGGKSGVDLGLAIIPGVLIICTFVLMLTNGPSADGFTGAAYEGIALLPLLASHINFILQPLFGLSSPEAIAFPITSIGAVGASMGLVPHLLEQNLIQTNDIAVFTAMGMCWSGYLSTHVAMMDGLKTRCLTTKAILSHTIGGLIAGISANFLFKGIQLLLNSDIYQQLILLFNKS